MASTEPQPFRLLDLPGEIRNRIYKIILCSFDPVSSQSWIVPPARTLDEMHPSCAPKGICPAKHSIETAILCTGKQVHREAYDVMVKTNMFISIESIDIPLSTGLIQSQVPIVTLDRERTSQFQGHVMDVLIKVRNDDGDSEGEGMALDDFHHDIHGIPPGHGPYFHFMILARDWEAFCQMLATTDLGEGFRGRQKFVFHLNPLHLEVPIDHLELNRDHDITDFFTKKIQKALLEPIRRRIRDCAECRIVGTVDRNYANEIENETVQPRWTDPDQFLAQLLLLKESGNEHYQAGDSVLAVRAWTEARLMQRLVQEGRSASILSRKGGPTFQAKFLETWFLLAMNCAQAYLKALSAQHAMLAPRHPILLPSKFPVMKRLGDLAMKYLEEARDTDYGPRWTPTTMQSAKLNYRYAMCLRLLNTNMVDARESIDSAMELAPSDPAIQAEQRAINEWMANINQLLGGMRS